MTDYEIYNQSNNQDWVSSAKKRYHTIYKEKAFGLMEYLNKTEESGGWRVAIRVKNIIIIDIDSTNIENIKLIVNSYSPLFGKLDVYRTNGGYHIHSKKYDNEWDWHYDCCRLLFPLLETKDIIKYLGKLKEWYNRKLKEEFELKWNKTEYIENIKKTFPQSGLYCGYGEFDIIFSLMVLLKGYYCIRISKKSIDDKVERILI